MANSVYYGSIKFIHNHPLKTRIEQSPEHFSCDDFPCPKLLNQPQPLACSSHPPGASSPSHP